MRKPKQQPKPLNDLSRSLTPFDPNQTLIVVVELSKESWLVAGIIPGVERQPLKKLEPNENEVLKLLERWRAEAEKARLKIPERQRKAIGLVCYPNKIMTLLLTSFISISRIALCALGA